MIRHVTDVLAVIGCGIVLGIIIDEWRPVQVQTPQGTATYMIHRESDLNQIQQLIDDLSVQELQEGLEQSPGTPQPLESSEPAAEYVITIRGLR